MLYFAGRVARWQGKRTARERASESRRERYALLSFSLSLALAFPLACRSRVTSHHVPPLIQVRRGVFVSQGDWGEGEMKARGDYGAFPSFSLFICQKKHIYTVIQYITKNNG